MNNATRQEQRRSKITLDSIDKSNFQKEGTLTAQIRQLVETKSYYPSKKTSSDMQANFFSNDDFGFKDQEFISKETRVAWLLVPVGATKEQVQAKLDAANEKGAVIYRVLSNQPILDDNQKGGLQAGLVEGGIDKFANSQALRFPENEKTIANGTAGKLMLDGKNNVQYRRTYFWPSHKDDMDLRDASNVYISAELKAELTGAGAFQGQDF